MKSCPKSVVESTKTVGPPSNPQWKSFSWKGRGSYVKANFNPVLKSSISRKNSEPLLKGKLPNRNLLSRSVSTYQETPSSPVTRNNNKPQFLKIFSKSTSNLFIGYSKPEIASKALVGEKCNRKFNPVVRISGKKVPSTPKIGDDITPKSLATKPTITTGLEDSTKPETDQTNIESSSEKSKGM